MEEESGCGEGWDVWVSLLISRNWCNWIYASVRLWVSWAPEFSRHVCLWYTYWYKMLCFYFMLALLFFFNCPVLGMVDISRLWASIYPIKIFGNGHYSGNPFLNTPLCHLG